MTPGIHIGIAGWSYADWKGIVYPNTRVDQLAYVSRFVDCIEINSSFYQPPSTRNSASWLRRTQDRAGFFFTAKLHQDITHAGRIAPSLVHQVHEGLAPLREAGRLRLLLAQFRYDMADTPVLRDRLTRIAASFGTDFELIVEVRHRSWQTADALDFLGTLGVGVCHLDYPLGRDSFALEHCPLGRTGYLRLHGRNAAAWFSKAGRDETYNYDYPPRELEQIAQRARGLASTFPSLVVIANNHYRGAELANAIELKHLLTGRKQAVPPGLVETYPRLQALATPPPEPGLFSPAGGTDE